MSRETRIMVELRRPKDSREIKLHAELDLEFEGAPEKTPEEKAEDSAFFMNLAQSVLGPLMAHISTQTGNPFGNPFEAPHQNIVHPGVVAAEHLDKMQWSVAQLAIAADLEVGVCQAFLDGRVDVDEHLAVKLAEHLGDSAEFWTALQDQYDQAQQDAPEPQDRVEGEEDGEEPEG